MIDLDRDLSRLISVSFMGGILGRLFKYGIYLVIARSLGAGALGVFSFGLVVLNVGTLVSKGGLDKAARKFVPIHSRTDNQAQLSGTLIVCLGGAFVLGLIVSTTLYLARGLIEAATVATFSTTIALFLVGIPFMALMTVGAAATTGFLTTRYTVYIKDVAQPGTAILLILLAVMYGGSLATVITVYVGSIMLASGLAVWFLVRQGGIRLLEGLEVDVRGIFGYSLPLAFAALAQYLAEWTDILMLSVFETAAVIGTYQAAYQTAAMLGFVLFSVNAIFPSLAADLYESGELEKLRNIYAVLTKWITYLTVLGYVYVVIFAHQILGIFGSEFPSARPALIVVGGVFVITSGVGPAGYLLMMSAYERVEVLNTLVASVINIGLNYLLIRQYGMVGAAIATGISLSLLNIARLIETWYLMRVRPRISNYWKGGLAIGASTFVLMAISNVDLPDIAILAISGVSAIGVFAVVVFMLGEDDEDVLLVESIA